MPTLPLAGDEPFAITLGIMLYPEPESDGAPNRKALAYRSQYMAKPIGRYRADGHSLSPEYLIRVVTEGGEPLDDIPTRFRQGLLAGQTLWIAFTLGELAPDRATWNNATKLQEIEATRQKVPGSRTLVREAKATFDPALHLWAAWCVCEDDLLQAQIKGDEHDGLRRYLRFLAISGALLHWGTAL